MAGKRLLDLGALFNATRGVAQKHVALRSRQVDVYNRTSTLARAVRSQTGRITETAKAASFLAGRLNESAPSWTAEATEEKVGSQQQAISSKESTEGTPASSTKGPSGENHFYERSAENSAVDPPPRNDLEVKQEKPQRNSIPDGTIPPTGLDLNRVTRDHDVVSRILKDEPKENPLGASGIEPKSSSASTIPIPTQEPKSSEATKILQRQSEDQIPSRTADALDDGPPDPLEAGHDEDSVYRKSTHTSPSLSSLPRVKLPKHTSDVQENGQMEGQINSDSFYGDTKSQTTKSQAIPAVQAVPEQDEMPEGVDTALFYSPRVAKLLGGKTHGKEKPELKMEGAKDTPIDHTKLAAGKDQDTFNVRQSSQKHPLDPSNFSSSKSFNAPLNMSTKSAKPIKDTKPVKRAETTKETEDFAEDLAKEFAQHDQKVSLTSSLCD